MVDVLIGFFTLWIFPVYKLAKLQAEAQEKAKVPVEDNTVMYIVLCCIGLAIVTFAIAQSAINKLVKSSDGQ